MVVRVKSNYCGHVFTFLKAIYPEDEDGILDLVVSSWDFVAIYLCTSISLSTLTSLSF
jgi:hypothetical protein